MAKTYSLDREAYLSFKPSLAQHLGVESAIVLQRLEFLISLTGGKVIDGEKYVWCTFEEWQKTHFPFWSLSTIKRLFKSLEDAHILEFKQPDGYMSRKKYYRINEGAYQKLTLEEAPIVSEWNDPSSQIDTIHRLKLTPSITEQSSEQPTVGTQPPKPSQKQEHNPPTNRIQKQPKDRASREEVEGFCVSLGLPQSDGEACFFKWEGNGWLNGGKPIKDWRSTIRSWKASGYLPSQKNGGCHPNGNANPAKSNAAPCADWRSILTPITGTKYPEWMDWQDVSAYDRSQWPKNAS